MPSYLEAIAHQYAVIRANRQRWRAVKQALTDDLPRNAVSRRIEAGLRAAEKDYIIAERQLFDVFDVITSNLVHITADYPLKERRERLLKRAVYHENIADNRDVDPEHAEMHRRVAQQLRELSDKRPRARL